MNYGDTDFDPKKKSFQKGSKRKASIEQMSQKIATLEMEHQSPQIVHSGSSITTFRVPMNAYTSQKLILLNQTSIDSQKRMSLSKPKLKTPLLNLQGSKSLGIIKLEASGLK